VITCGEHHGVPVVCGDYTPSEILAAWESGADLVKVFPARSLGSAYVKDVLAALPNLHLVPTGEVDIENCAAFLKARAYTVAVGSSLVADHLVSEGDWGGSSAPAQRYVEACTLSTHIGWLTAPRDRSERRQAWGSRIA
jgi:2-dehydro-3-deoxyphosphogluconate aldolase/(4S)-4-hydroxy-2-oxoglutarate aldolase